MRLGQESINGFSSTNYPSDATCTWVFQWQWDASTSLGLGSDGFVPSVELTGKIEDTPKCDHDYVQVNSIDCIMKIRYPQKLTVR